VSISAWDLKAGVYSTLSSVLIPSVADLVLPGRPVEVPSTQTPRRVYVGNVLNDIPQPIFEPGSQLRLEQYVLPLLIDCMSYTGNDLDGHQVAEGLVAAIATAIENQLRADPSWGAVVDSSGLALSAEDTSVTPDGPGGAGWRSGAILELHVKRSRP
jgi:hypothetical protein